jgi:hypothetical protein
VAGGFGQITKLGLHAELCGSELGFRDQVADALHNDAMGPTQFDALQLDCAQKFINSASADIENVGSAINGHGQPVIEIHKMSLTTLAHGDKHKRTPILK